MKEIEMKSPSPLKQSKAFLWIGIAGAGFGLALLAMILLSFFNLEASYAWGLFTLGMLLGTVFGAISMFTTYQDLKNNPLP